MKKLLKKKVNVFGKGVPVLAIFVLGIALVSAGLIDYFGVLTGTVIIDQGLKLDGKDWNVPVTYSESLTSLEAKTVSSGLHYLTNDADVNGEVTLNTVCSTDDSGNDCIGITTTTEYKLNSEVDDDALFVILDSSITWSSFNSASFDYLIESDGGNLWIPQMNIALRNDDGEVVYGVSWHSFRTDITGVVNERTSMIFEKDDFYIYGTEFSLIPASGKWSEAGEDLRNAMNPLQFSYFTRQAGDTSIDPNPEVARQIVWLSNFAMNPETTMKGIKVPTSAYEPATQVVEFEIVTDFPQMLVPDTYTITTEVVLAE